MTKSEISLNILSGLTGFNVAALYVPIFLMIFYSFYNQEKER